MIKTQCLLLFLSLALLSCNHNKQQLIDEYRSISSLIEKKEYSEVLEKLDAESLQFIEFLTDTANLTYETMKRFGDSKNLTMFTTAYNHVVGDVMQTENGNKEFFLMYLGITEVPMFSVLTKITLLEDQTKVGSENYVVVGTKINQTTFLTTKIHFTKSTDAQYRLNLLDLLKFREKLLRQAYQNYVHNLGLIKIPGTDRTFKRTDAELPEDMLLSFLNDMMKEEHRLTEITYNKSLIGK